jgi:hypothetical protein
VRTGPWVQLRRPIGWVEGLPLAAALLAFVAVTNRWLGWDGGFSYVQANDERAYLTIARAFPGLPDQRIADQHAQRWVVHWAIGGLSDLFGTAPQTTYYWVAAALAIAVSLVLTAVLIRLGVSLAAAAVALAVFILSPYAFRFYAFAPGYLADLVFELGLVVALLALARRSLPLLLLGLAAGALGRQTMLVVVPVVVVWVALAAEWRRADGRRPWAAAAAVLIVPAVSYMVVKGVAADFSNAGFELSRLTILDTVMDLPETASDLANHVAHTAIVLIVVTALLAATLPSLDLRRQPAELWGPLAIGAAIVLQVLVLNPDPIAYDYSSSNEPRLAAMALPALAVAFAVARRNVEQASLAARENAPALAVAGVLLLAVASSHQRFTIVSTGSAGVTFALQLAAGAAFFAMVWVGDRHLARSRPRPG